MEIQYPYNNRDDDTVNTEPTTEIYVINGFYTCMRDSYFSSGIDIDYMLVEWDGCSLSWFDLLKNVIGDRDPSKACSKSIRGILYKEWKNMGLAQQPNILNNCVHASASAFEALVERLIWIKGIIIFKN
jgi:hypothetical protein